MIKATARPRRVSKDGSKRTEIQTVDSIRKAVCLWPSSAASNTQWSAIVSAACHDRDAYNFLKDQRGNRVSWKQRDHAELKKAVLHLEQDFTSLARAQANSISVAIFRLVPRSCKSPYVLTSNNLRNGSLLTTANKTKRLAETETEQQGTSIRTTYRHDKHDATHKTPRHTMRKTTTAIREPHNHVVQHTNSFAGLNAS
ncbi:hypothetical protein BCR37DRAFT_54006 [Protomyces lactucae-debilis]|uniref:Uncharacterized protein n=1 Tax=Protomyces lactucae-debilis TaxID=2754530 RepID=A0A1Y2FA88_PROLT|nr:uncharacterized protein BCR37DRAFT_54006 [Protomyces lactucae-debilis]ORY80828.1 hypothetical protein BCR37DRAFT_54006 [Protomyces lactucae-debilis]